ncbi:MAG: flagellar export chaperone FlgN [Candidatus Scalindua sp.]|nr:flagellar export chaperone FlgN [Candidatus Scalindua sp.]
MNMKNNSIGFRGKIISYFERELRYYEKLGVLAKQQDEVIQSGDIKKLEFLIKEKENCIKEISQSINSNGESIEELLYHDQTALSDKTVKMLLKKKHSLLTALLHYDQNSIDLLTSSIDDIKIKTGFLGKRRKILNALKLQQSETPRYLDVVK